MHTAEEVLLGKVEVNGPVVVCGGGEVGCETAAFLGVRIPQVDIVEMREDILIGSLHQKAIHGGYKLGREI